MWSEAGPVCYSRGMTETLTFWIVMAVLGLAGAIAALRGLLNAYDREIDAQSKGRRS